MTMRKKINKTVYEASLERIAYCFDNFDNVLVSFSGGKDSGVMLNLCYQYAKENNLLHKLAIYHMDYEAQYSYTTEYVTRTFERLSDIRRFWLCLPISANCACKMDSNLWIPWNKDEKKRWCRKIPRYKYVITEKNVPFDFKKGTYGKSVKYDFCKWFEKEYGSTAVMVGLRCDESLDRRRAINLISGFISSDNFVYPIYDWTTEDIWVANYKFKWDYNKIYDLFYKSGLQISSMRVANPFHTCGMENLKLYRVIEPKTWAKLLNRVNGVVFGGLYGGTAAFGFKGLIKPKHFTWEEYTKFLIKTNPKPINKDKINMFISKWKQQGYLEGIPDEADYFMEKKRDVPSWRRICSCLLKNDFLFTGLGFNKVKTQAYHIIKRINLGVK